MHTINEKLLPMMKSKVTHIKSMRPDWNWSEIHAVMNAFGFRLIFLTCLCPILTIVPAFATNLAIEAASFTGFLLALILLIPWIVIPTLFIQHLTNRSKFGIIASFVYAGLLLVSYIIWIFAVPL
ncbi:hypothetical protein FIU87_18780 [Bacillus sp. THAF10]|uniref:hypothetical protein n=1 Tax=Bacillus sp. THAF10 TaxID=2587848 RepID=UPI001269616C|nr:hypothetical protein [Bacillus sp. THAF10]QFT90694.1 hypothetical protein FIU87_18780 [Bacillus sp. THAF10]